MSDYNTAEYKFYEQGCNTGRRGTAVEEFRCSICGDAVYENEPTEVGLTILTCRDSVCVDKRLKALLQAEQDLVKLKAEMRKTLLAIALRASHEAEGLAA